MLQQLVDQDLFVCDGTIVYRVVPGVKSLILALSWDTWNKSKPVHVCIYTPFGQPLKASVIIAARYKNELVREHILAYRRFRLQNSLKYYFQSILDHDF